MVKDWIVDVRRARYYAVFVDGGVEILMWNTYENIFLPSRCGSVGIFAGIMESGPDAEFVLFPCGEGYFFRCNRKARKAGRYPVRVDGKHFLVAVFLSFNERHKEAAGLVIQDFFEKADVEVVAKMLSESRAILRQQLTGAPWNSAGRRGARFGDLLFGAVTESEHGLRKIFHHFLRLRQQLQVFPFDVDGRIERECGIPDENSAGDEVFYGRKKIERA